MALQSLLGTQQLSLFIYVIIANGTYELVEVLESVATAGRPAGYTVDMTNGATQWETHLACRHT
jgi:hypothetical protein